MQKIDRSIVRNEAYQKKSVFIRERHNERKNQGYSNPDIVTDRSHLNVHFKTCEGSYAETFDKMLEAGTISTRGLQPDAKIIDELVFDVNTAYFDRNGGYEYAKNFFAEAYRLAVQEAGGEQYVLSAVMHADERNRALSEQLGRDVFHYHLHVVYVPVVDKEIKWSKRCKDPALVGTTREVIKQVSHSKKWPKLKQLDRDGKPVLSKNGKAVLINSYSLLQDRFFEHMRAASYTDFERGERGSTAEHLSVLDYKIQQDTQHISSLNEVIETKENTAALLDKKVEKQMERLSGLQEKIAVTKQADATFSEIEGMTKKTIGGNVQLSPADWKTVSGLAKKGVTAEGDIADLKKQLATAKKDAQIYKSRWERLLEETKLFREAVKHAPRLVKEFLSSVFRRPPEKQKPEQRPKRRNKDMEL